jgi:hypothetical protein
LILNNKYVKIYIYLKSRATPPKNYHRFKGGIFKNSPIEPRKIAELTKTTFLQFSWLSTAPTAPHSVLNNNQQYNE